MLSYDERRRLGHIETWLRIEDPDFAEGIRAGLPRAPREYRRWPSIVLIAFGMLALLVGALFGNLLAAVPGAAALAAGTRLWLRRQLDGPGRTKRRG
jgi:hypothetical protein